MGRNARWQYLDAYDVFSMPDIMGIPLVCRELDNLYVVDASFFPSIGAVNPSLTIIANALRVGDHLLERL